MEKKANTPSVKWSALCLAAVLVLGISPAVQADKGDLRVNAERIEQHIMALAQFGKNPQGGVRRARRPAGFRGRR